MEALLLTGVFGVGKSTVAADVADLLEHAGAPYAALDLDWLMWSNVADGEALREDSLLLRNLAAVVANYRSAGARYFVLALSVRDRDGLDVLAAEMPMPLRSIELRVPVDEIKRRLATDPTPARRDDLATAIAWNESGHGSGFAEHVVHNSGPVRAVTTEVLRLVGWPSQPRG